jgi:hypothetical protein
MTATTTPRANRYAGKARCGCWIPAGKGVLTGNRSVGYGVAHADGDTCTPPAPRASGPLPKPALGYYVRNDGAAIKVVPSKRLDDDGTPRHYGLVFTPRPGQRPIWDYVKGAGISVADMRPMTATDAAQLGLSHGHCIACCAPLGGETLSAHVSALIGYGETCSVNNGWPYPKGVKAQRAYIADRARSAF